MGHQVGEQGQGKIHGEKELVGGTEADCTAFVFLAHSFPFLFCYIRGGLNDLWTNQNPGNLCNHPQPSEPQSRSWCAA